jgi:hypothetical protein
MEMMLCPNVQLKNALPNFPGSGVEDLKDESHARHPVAVSDVSINELLESKPQLSTRQIAERLNSSKTTVERKLDEMGKVWKLGSWLPHELTESQRGVRFSICSSLLSRLECVSHSLTTWLLVRRNGSSILMSYGNVSG